MAFGSGRSLRFYTLALGLLCVSAAFGQAPKKTLKDSDYGQWESIAASHLSHDGRWLAYKLDRVDGESKIVIRNVDGPQTWAVPNGTLVQFSDDSKWVAYSIDVPKAEADKLREQKKPVEKKLGLRNLATGEEQTTESVETFHFLKGGKYLLAHRYRGAAKQEGGSDVQISNLADGTNITVGNVVSVFPNHAETLLAMQVQSDSGFKGIQVFDPQTSTLRTLSWGRNDITNIEWVKDKEELVFLSGSPNEKKDGAFQILYKASDLRAPKPTVVAFDPQKVADFPKGKRIVEFSPVTVNEDGSCVVFGVRDWQDKKPDTRKPEDKPHLEVWNVKDVQVQPYQKVHSDEDLHSASICAWWPKTSKFVQVANEPPHQSVSLIKGYHYAVLDDGKPYASPVNNGIDYSDIYLVDMQTGARTKVLTNSEWGASDSEGGKYVTYFKGGNWFIYDIAKRQTIASTSSLKAHFERQDDDHTVPEKPPVAAPVWFQDDKGVLFYDKYDAYLWKPGDTTPAKITDGAPKHLIYRAVNPDRDAETPGFNLTKPLYFTVFDDLEKSGGYYLRSPNGEGKMLIFADKAFGTLDKARDADRMLFAMGDFNESPNLYITNGVFTQAKRSSKTNPQQADFAWSKSELIRYKNKSGQDLQGVLIYPANYEPGRSYPMVVYIYEKLSDSLHRYTSPSVRNPYDFEGFAQNGYFVLMPDIVYRPRNPGFSAVECVEPAVDAVIKRGLVDPSKVGIMGHSWGAYQTCFIAAKSKKFRAAVAGAPLTDLISMYGSFYWNTGTPDQAILESSQGRLQVPYWIDLKAYIENSPLFNATGITAPLLVEEGDADGAVDWHQSQELYTTMRRMGKQMVLLLYQGENHNLAKKANQLDYAHRIRHWFDVYLKGTKPEPWVTEGVPYNKRDEVPEASHP